MVVLAAFFFSVNGSVAKTILRTGISAPDLTTFRALGAAVGLVAIGTVLRPGLKRFRVTKKELPLIVVYGLTGFFTVPMLYFVAISRLPVGIGLLFEFTAPLFIALWARFGQGEKVKARLWIGFALSLAGLAIVAEIWGDLTLDPVGVGAGLISAVLLAVYFVLGARGAVGRDTISLTGLAFVVSAAAGFVVKAIGGGLPDWSVLKAETPSGVPIWLLCCYLIVLGTIVPYVLVLGGLRHLPATSVGILGMTEPVMASAVAWLALNESLNAAQLAGGAILLAGVVLAETARVTVRQNEPHAANERAPEREGSPAATG
jgi:drug/metabolite transporter (DMT)-like permease